MIDGLAHLDWLRTGRSIRVFADRPIDRAVLERLVEAATLSPSSTNRQPWRFAVITGAQLRRQIAAAARARTEQIKEVIRRGHHGEEFEAYGDFFFEPLESAAAIVVPQYRDYPDGIAHLIESGGGKLADFHTPAEMQVELCSASAAIMALLLQAHAEGLGACWMAGPTVARDEIHALLDICPPWRMLGAIALGHRAANSPSAPPRKPLAKVAQWYEEERSG